MKKLIFSVLLLLMTVIGAVAQETLTVYESETGTNECVPIYGLYVDTEGLKCEFIIPSTEMEAMENGTITAMSFYLQSQAAEEWNASFQVFLKEVDQTTMTGFLGTTDATVVYSGVLNANSSTMDINFTENYVYGGGNLLVGIYLTSTGTWKSAKFYGKTTTENTAWQGYSSYSGKKFIPKTTFTYTPGAAPTCSKVNNLVANNITSSSADITWEAGGTETAWVLKYGPAGFDVETEGVTKNISGTPTFQITELTANTAYSVYVKAVCGVGDESAWKSASFRTECGTESVPWSEDFDSQVVGDVPACWTKVGSGSVLVNNGNANSGLYSLKFSGVSGGNIIALPQFGNEISGLQLSFYTRPEGYNYSSCGTFEVGYITDLTDASTFVSVESYAYNSWTSNTYEQKEIVMSSAPAGSYFAFNHNANATNYFWFVDDISVNLPPSCIKPTALAYSNVAARTVGLSWTAGGTETAWQICKSNAPGSEDIIDVTTNPYTLNNLDPETTYLVKVRAKCSESDFSEWTSNISFTTAIACPAPTALVFSDITNNYVSMSWTAGSSESRWNLQYKKSSEEDWSDVIEVTTNPITNISGLEAGTTYNVRVQADCELDGTSTAWLTGTFTTAYGIPFVEGFGTLIPANWSQKSGLLANVITGTALTSGSGWNFGTGNGVFDNHARINIWGTSKKDWLLTPTIVMDANVELTFNLALTAYNGDLQPAATTGTDDKFVVLISTDNGATWTILRQYDNAGSEYVYNDIPAAGEEVAINLSSYSSDNVIIAFYGESTTTNADNNLHIDNVSLDYIRSCIKPTALTVSNVLARTADLAWTAGADETAWQICLNDVEDDEHLINVNGEPSYTLTGLTPVTAYTVKVRANCGGDVSAWTSNISFTTTVACPVPTALAYADVTTNSVVLSWTAGGSETAWQICINNNEDDLVDVTENPYTLTGLTPATTYSIKVRANCGDTDGNSQWTSAVSFTTECEALAVDADHPYTEGFEDVTASYAIPTCWERIVEYTSYGSTYPYVYSYGAHNGSKCLYMYSYPYYDTYENIIALPEMNSISTLQISLWAKASSTIPENFEIGYIKNGVFTSVQSFTLTTTYQQFTAYLNGAPADAEKIAIRAHHSSSSITVYVDDIEVSPMPTCIAPVDVVVSGITTNAASVSWTDVLSATAWQYRLNEGEIFDAEANPINLTELTANTEYTVKVRTACGEGEYSEWATTTFTTPCGAITELPYTESFESETCPASCWSIEYAVANPASSNIMNHVADYAKEGSRSFRFSSYSSTSDYNQYLISPMFNIEGSYVVSFYYRQRSTSEHLYFGTSSTGNAISDFTWTTEEIPAYSATWTLYKTVVPAGTKYFAINYRPGSSLYYAWIDNIVVREVSSAAEILTYTLPTEAAPASITSGANTGTIDITVTNSTDFDADLNPTYTISDYAEISAPVITGDGDSRTITYTVTAEAGNTKEWTVNVTRVSVSHDAFITGFTFAGQKAGTTAEIVSNTESNTYTVNAVAEWNVDLTSIAPEITVSPAAEITPESGYARDFTSPVTYTVTAEDGTTFHIYNVTIINDPYACVNPTAVNANDITDATATLSWAQAYTETSYIVKVSTEEMTNMAATADVFDGTVYATTKALENLTANTQYFVYVQSNCDNAEDWTEYSFRTECGVFAVPFVETFENNSETVNCWTAISNNTENDVASGKMGIFDVSGNSVFRFSSYSRASNEDYNQYLITPELALTEDAVLTFDYAKSNNSNENFRVMTSTTDANIASFTALGDDVTANSTNFTEYRIVVPAATKYIAINYFSNYQYYLYVDNFKLTNVYTITASADSNGSIDQNGNVEVEYGESQSFTIAPDDCYHIASVLVDDVEAINDVVDGIYTFANVTANHTIAATFAINTYNITATAGEGGSITETSAVNCGANKEITITANEGYRIASVIVDETENVTEAVIAAEGVYTFENVTADHTIAATFERVHTISAGTGADGSITPEGIISVLDGESQTFTITPVNECFRIGQVMVDGVDVTDEVIANNGVYTFENVTENHNIVANFDAITLTITATAGEGGTITHNSDYEIIPCASNESYTIVANDGYRIVSVIVDGEFDVTNEVVANNGVYTFTNVRADHTIAATFGLIPSTSYTITATAGENGTITPNGEVEVYEGDNQNFTITPATGYRIAAVVVDAETEGETDVIENVVAGDGVFFYTFENVTANHTIHATFEQIPTYTITVEAGENGNVYYNDALVSAPIVVTEGATPEFEITPETGYQIDVLTVGGNTVELTEQQLGGFTYTFDPVMADITLTVTFKAIPVTTYTITATAGENGTINPEGEVTVTAGENKEFTITPAEGYRIATLVVDAETEGETDVTENVVAGDGVFFYTFTNVTANHTIHASFEAIPTYTITVEAGENGNVYYNDALVSDPIVVTEGATPEFEITPATGYQIDVLTVGGNTVELTEQQLGGFTYTFDPVRADITLAVTFTFVNSADMIEAGSLSIYPNPNNGMFSIDFSNIEGDATYQIIDARGAVVETRDINVMNGETMNFNHDLRPGAYFVRIINGDKVYVEQIVVE